MNIVYSVKDEKFNATKLVEAISDKNISDWIMNSDTHTLLNRFRSSIITKEKKSRPLDGDYFDQDLFSAVICWANPSRGRF
jgi:hypothetical protein